MTRGLRIPVAFPHDGHQHDRGSGLSLAMQYKNFGANMMAGHAKNHGTNTNSVEPALEEIREMMFSGKLIIAGHNNELLDKIRNYHRSEDYKLVKQRDDLVSAFRYAVMMRRQGLPLSSCDGVGYGNMPYAHQHSSRGHSRYAIGTANHPGGDFDVFTGA
jgi:hypothetical protein